MTEGYCVKCRKKRELKDTEPFTMNNGRKAVRAHCTVCGATVVRIGA